MSEHPAARPWRTVFPSRPCVCGRSHDFWDVQIVGSRFATPLTFQVTVGAGAGDTFPSRAAAFAAVCPDNPFLDKEAA